MSRLILAIAVALVALFTPAPAWAVAQCGDQQDVCQCGMNNPYPCCENGGNCTWWAWEAACCNWGVGLPGWGNANQWAGNANANPNYSVFNYPVTQSVSCRTSGTYGHVAYVTSVSGSNISVTEQNCWGNYGMRSWNYSSSYFQAYITRKGATECKPGDSQTQACGRCGTQTRACQTSGKWGTWSACSGEGPCAPGQTDSQTCGQCGTRTRTCGGSCQWGPFPPGCGGPDPDGGTVACDTGLPGACAAAILRCVDGGLACPVATVPAAEACDGEDNDCNGAIDDSPSCASPPHLTGEDGGACPCGEEQVEGEQWEKGPLPAEVSGGCGCSTPSEAVGLSALLALWFAASLRRRR